MDIPGKRISLRLFTRRILGHFSSGLMLVAASLLLSCSSTELEKVAVGTVQQEPSVEQIPQTKTASKPKWKPLADDGLHDPSNPALELLQEPAEALSELPPAKEGNQVDWAAALRSGEINPRTNIYPETNIRVLDLDILMEETAAMPVVRFPHRPHTEWLDCKNCHDRIFIAKRGANNISMLSILQGEACGQCHGAVSFPLTQCARCHSVERRPETLPS